MSAHTSPSKLRALGVAFGAGVAGFVLGFALLFAAALLLGAVGVGLSAAGVVVLSLVALQGVAFPAVAAATLRLRGKSLDFVPLRMPSLRDVGWIGGGYALSFALAAVLLLVVSATNAPTASRTDQQLLFQPDVLLLLVPLSFVFIGPGEELLFRGIIQGTLREAFGPVGSVVLANLAFAPAHVVALAGSPVALLVSVSVLFVPSLVFGAAYERTGNFAVPALVHAAYDATIFGLVYLALTFGGAQQAGLLGGGLGSVGLPLP